MQAIGINQNDSKKAKYGPQSSPQEIIAEPAKHEILTAVVTWSMRSSTNIISYTSLIGRFKPTPPGRFDSRIIGPTF